MAEQGHRQDRQQEPAEDKGKVASASGQAETLTEKPSGCKAWPIVTAVSSAWRAILSTIDHFSRYVVAAFPSQPAGATGRGKASR